MSSTVNSAWLADSAAGWLMSYSSPVQVRGVRPFSLAKAADFSSINGRSNARSAAIQSLMSVQLAQSNCCRRAGRQHVFAGAGPDIADDMVDREAKTRGGFHRYGRRDAPGAQEHPVRIRLAYLAPLRRLFIARVGHRNLDIFKAVFLCQQLQRAKGFAPVGRVVIDRGDFLALEFVETAFTLGDVVHQG